MPDTTAVLALPFPEPGDANDYPGQMQDLAERLDAIGGGIAAVTTAARDALAGVDLWEGRVVWNTTTELLNIYEDGAWTVLSYVPLAGGTATGNIAAKAAGNDGKATIGSSGDAGLLAIENDGATANGDDTGVIDFYAQDSGGNRTRYTRIHGKATDVTDGTEDGQISVYTTVAGAEVEHLRIGSVVRLVQSVLYNGAADRLFQWGAGSPEGVITSSIGGFYLDTTNGLVYVKRTGAGNTGWIANPAKLIGARAFRSGALNIATASSTAILWDAETFDTNTLHDLVTNPSRFTVPASMAGYWDALLQVRWPANSTGIRQAWFNLNGAAQPAMATEAAPSATQQTWQQVALGPRLMSAGDYLEGACYQTSGGNLDISSSETFMSMRYLGAA